MYQVKVWSVIDNAWKVMGEYPTLSLARTVAQEVASVEEVAPYITRDGYIVPDNAE